MCFVQASKAQFVPNSFPFLTNSAMPAEYGLSGAFTSLPSSSSTAVWYSPAQLGFNSSDKSNIRLGINPNNSWFFDAYKRSDYAIRYQGKSTLINRASDWGIAILHTSQIHEDYTYRVSNTVKGYDSTYIRSAFNVSQISNGASIQFNEGINIAFGYSLKWFFAQDDLYNYNFNRILHDIGLIVELDFIDFLSLYNYERSYEDFLFTYRFGYALKNVGRSFTINNPDSFWLNQTLAMPQTTSFGQSLTIGLFTYVNNARVQLFALDFTRDAFDLQQRSRSQNQKITEIDISVWDQLFRGNNKPGIDIAQGIRLALYESVTLSYSSLSYYISNQDSFNDSVWGLQVSLDGLKKMYVDKMIPFFKPVSFHYSFASGKDTGSVLHGFELTYSF